jgi:hypothetical protein
MHLLLKRDVKKVINPMKIAKDNERNNEKINAYIKLDINRKVATFVN